MKKSITTLALVTTLVAGAAQAATSSSTAKSSAVAPRLLDRVSMSLTNVLYGPSVKEPLAAHQRDKADGSQKGDAVYIENVLGTSYKLTDKVAVGATVVYNFTPVGIDSSGNNELAAAYLKASNKSLISRGAYNLSGEARLYAPVSNTLIDSGYRTSVRLIQSQSLALGKSPFSLSLTTFEQAYLQAPSDGKKMLRFYVSPAVEAQLNKSLTAQLYYEADYSSKKGALSKITSDYLLSSGVSWDVTSRINLNPYLSVRPNDDFGLNTTTYNIAATWKLL